MPSAADLARGRAGAVVYAPGACIEPLFLAFAAELKARGWRVGGLLQRTTRDADGRKLGMELIDVGSGDVLPLGQSLGAGAGHACIVDQSAMAEATAVLRHAIDSRVDLLMVNKFSHLDAAGGGFADEMLQAMLAGIPVLTSVQATLLKRWSEFCGAHCDLLAADTGALWRWWGPRRLYADLAQGVGEGTARRVLVGMNWTMVEGPNGVGLAASPARDTSGCAGKLAAGSYAGRPLRELASMVHGWNPFEAAVGLAAINAHYNRFDLVGEDVNGLDLMPTEGRVVVVGAFPRLAERIPHSMVVERDPREGEFPEHAVDWLLPGADALLATGSTLANGSLPRLLQLAAGAEVALVGPSVTLSPRLFDHGVTILSGLVAEDVEGMARMVAEGGGGGAVKRFGRQVTLRR
jgi:uncharacterized protein (DUF4213/DUF364 family)